MKKDTRLNIMIDAQTHEILKKLAYENKKTLGKIVREAIEQYLGVLKS